MERKLTVEDARQSLNSHAIEKGLQLREKYGPQIGWKELRRILEDRSLGSVTLVKSFSMQAACSRAN